MPMTVAEALAQIAPVVGLTSVIGAPESVLGQAADGPTLDGARAQYEHVRGLQNGATSDAGYWGYAGQVSYWKAVVLILEAAELVGADNLAIVDTPRTGGMVMSDMAEIERFGQAIKDAAEAAAQPA